VKAQNQLTKISGFGKNFSGTVWASSGLFLSKKPDLAPKARQNQLRKE
jgi:hypothetical protein